jgi:hypothetical protein
VVLVLHGDWLDIVAADQDKALAARAYAYSGADGVVLSAGGGAHSLRRGPGWPPAPRTTLRHGADNSGEPTLGCPQLSWLSTARYSPPESVGPLP